MCVCVVRGEQVVFTHTHTHTHTHTVFEMLAQCQMIWMLLSMSVGWTLGSSTAHPIKDKRQLGTVAAVAVLHVSQPPAQKLFLPPSSFLPPPPSSLLLCLHSSLPTLLLLPLNSSSLLPCLLPFFLPPSFTLSHTLPSSHPPRYCLSYGSKRMMRATIPTMCMRAFRG